MTRQLFPPPPPLPGQFLLRWFPHGQFPPGHSSPWQWPLKQLPPPAYGVVQGKFYGMGCVQGKFFRLGIVIGIYMGTMPHDLPGTQNFCWVLIMTPTQHHIPIWHGLIYSTHPFHIIGSDCKTHTPSSLRFIFQDDKQCPCSTLKIVSTLLHCICMAIIVMMLIHSNGKQVH